MSRRSSAVVGAVALCALVVVLFGLTRFLGGAFKRGYEVTATFARAGQLLRPTSDVKLRGVLVGEVTQITVERSGRAKIAMRLFPEQKIPDNITATIRAKTLFGEKYVAFATPPNPSGRSLRPGSQIPESRTTPPLEVETVLARAVPVLNAIDPPRFAAALHALAQAFVGNTDELRRATVQGETLLTQTERTLPNLQRNLVHLKHFASAFNQSDTDLLRALDGLSAVGDVLRAHPGEFDATLRNLVPLATDLGDVFTARQADLGDLAGEGRAVLDQVAKRARKLPDLVRALDGFLGAWVADLSEGPNWRIFVTSAPGEGHTYPPGTEPRPEPRVAALRRITANDSSVGDLADLLLAPVPTQDLQHMPEPSARLPVLRPLPLISL